MQQVFFRHDNAVPHMTSAAHYTDLATSNSDLFPELEEHLTVYQFMSNNKQKTVVKVQFQK
jgi:hypothetical protein